MPLEPVAAETLASPGLEAARPAADEPTPRRFDSPEQEAFLGLWRTYDRLRAIEDAVFEQFGITAQQYNALRLLKAAHPTPLPTLLIASRLISRAPDITRLIDRLVEQGLVTRTRPVDNRRTVLVGITAAGLDLLQTMGPAVVAGNHQQLGHLPPEELTQLVELLRKARRPHEVADSPWR